MNEVCDILALADQACDQGIDAVLATVVDIEGSAYRRPGAMMLICADGRSAGMVSGGCLERHLIQRAFWLTRDGACVQTYQTGTKEDRLSNQAADPLQAFFMEDADSSSTILSDASTHSPEHWTDDDTNFGLGCHGSVQVLFERLSDALPMLAMIRQVRRDQRPIGLATLLSSTSLNSTSPSSLAGSAAFNPPLECGSRYVISDQAASTTPNTFQTALLPKSEESITDFLADAHPVANDMTAQLQAVVTQFSQQLGAKRRWQIYYHNTAQQRLKWLVQYLMPPIHLLICGAGNDAIPLAQLAKMLDWRVSVIDSRPHLATSERFFMADHVQVVALEDGQTVKKLSNQAAVAVMSHSLTQDRARLKVLLTQPPSHWRYLGQLGPRYRTERLIHEIAQQVSSPDTLQNGVSNLHYPIGFKLGGDTPEALALGIIAQISALLYQQFSHPDADQALSWPISASADANNSERLNNAT